MQFGYVYDGLDRQVSFLENGSLPVINQVYGPEGRLDTMARGGPSVTFGHDPLDRLTGLAVTGLVAPVAFTYAWNPASQIVAQTRDNDAYAYTGHVSGQQA